MISNIKSLVCTIQQEFETEYVLGIRITNYTEAELMKQKILNTKSEIKTIYT